MPTSNGAVKSTDLAALFAKRVRTVELHLTDDPTDVLTVKYKPDALNKKLQAELKATESEDAAAVLMLRLLVDWSLTVDGEPYPITTENLEALGLPILLTIASVVQEDFTAHVSLGKTMTAPTTPTPQLQD